MSGVDLMAQGEGLLPDIGARYRTGGVLDTISMHEVDRPKYIAALAKIGVTEKRMEIYQVESIADGVIVLAHQADA
jgi:hypothetical protein